MMEKQFPSNLFLKGVPSWNVPLANTLHNLPPSIHENALQDRQMLTHKPISAVKTIQNSDFILTVAKDGSINVWNTRLRLQRVGQHNFKSKLYIEEEIELNSNILS